MQSIDYSKYTLDELLDVQENIDRKKYPERLKMVEQLIDLRLTDSKTPTYQEQKVDYSNDLVAKKTRWSPISSGGANFITHELIKVSDNRMEFRASIGAKCFAIFFMVAGVVASLSFTSAAISSSRHDVIAEVIIANVISFVFIVVGISMLFKYTKAIVFDKSKGLYWKSRKEPENFTSLGESIEGVPLSLIHAIQLISEYIKSNDGSYYSHEMNLVLKDGKRLNVIDYGDEEQLRIDASQLAEMLDKPIWENIEDSSTFLTVLGARVR